MYLAQFVLWTVFCLMSQLKMKPQVHYGEDDCPLSAPRDFPKDDELHFEIEIIDFFKAKVGTSKRNHHSLTIIFSIVDST